MGEPFGAQPRGLDSAALLLSGPRGRRMLLDLAVQTEEARGDVSGEASLGYAVFHAAYGLEPADRCGALFTFSSDGSPDSGTPDLPEYSVAEVPDRLGRVPLTEPTAEQLFDALMVAVDTARYWQEPDGDDLLAGQPEIIDQLRRVAEVVAGSPHTDWWFTPTVEDGQWAVQWEGATPVAPLTEHSEVLKEARQAQIEGEARARRERPDDLSENWTGSWWSKPPFAVPSSTRALAGGAPVKLSCVEDGFGWDRGEAQRLGVPPGLRIFEIDSAAAWADLCRRFPLEVTAEVRHDWFRTTGRAGTWIIPDWAGVAETYDAVHLQVGAYLAAAGRVIPVAPGSGFSDAASMIAGWDPDETFWFTHRVRYTDEPVAWVAVDTDGGRRWSNY